MRRLWVLPLVGALAGCPPSIDTGNDGGGIIFAGPEGGIFIREGVAIDIPKDALATEAQIIVSVLDSSIPEVPGRKRVSLGYRLSPSSLVFKQPVKMIIPYLEDRVPQGVDPGTFDMRRQGGEDAYLQLPGGATDTTLKVVEARSERLGLFWLTSPAEPAVSKITLEPMEANLRVGDTQQFTASVTDPAGTPLELTLSWSVLPPRAATIDANGLLTATGPGTATVTVQGASLSATATVRIQGSAVGPQTFLHDTPFPTGNDLWGGALLNGAAFFVGANGTVIARSPSDVWTRHHSGPGVTLKAVAGTSIADAVAVGVVGTQGVLVEMQGSTHAPKVTTFATVEPRALWFDGTYGMAVGTGNDVLIRRNGSWTREFSPSFETLLSVVGDGNGSFTTLGNRGSIYQFDPLTQTWNSLFQTQLSVLLTAGVLVNAAGTEAWAAGGNKLWHFANSAWTAINLPPAPALSEITAVAVLDGKIALAGREGKVGHLLIYDPLTAADAGVASPDAGSADGGILFPDGWAGVALRGPQVIRGLFAQGSDGYAVGDYGAVWQYSAGQFTEVSRGFYGHVADVAIAGTTVVAAVNECVDATCANRNGRVMIRTGSSSWEELGPGGPFSGPLFSVALKSATEVLAGQQGQIYRFDGNGWSPVTITGGLVAPYNDIQFCGNTVYAVASGGLVFRGTSTSLTALAPLTASDLYAVHCPTETEVWVAGDRVLFERTALSSFAPRSSTGVNHGAWRAVWSPGQGEAYAFGDDRYGVYWNTGALTAIDAPGGILPDVLTGLWGSSVDNLYAVGHTLVPFPFGYAVRFDGAYWRLVDSGSQRKVTSIAGSSNSEIWLGTEGGGVLRGVMP